MTFFTINEEFERVGGGGGGGGGGGKGPSMLHMHAYDSSCSFFKKGCMSKFVPCPLHSGTLVWTPSQLAPQANRAYLCGSGGRGPPSMK